MVKIEGRGILGINIFGFFPTKLSTDLHSFGSIFRCNQKLKLTRFLSEISKGFFGSQRLCTDFRGLWKLWNSHPLQSYPGGWNS